MQAAVYRGASDMRVEDVPVPVLGPGDVLVEVSRCGICGSDVHLVTAGFARPGSVLGHEWSGRIVAIGAEVTGWQVGQRVVSSGDRSCGECRPCRAGRASVCRARPPVDHLDHTGAYSDYFVTPAWRVLPIPDGVDDRTAALTEPLAVALHGVNVARVQPGDRVLVTGAGPIGLLTVAVLATRGVSSIVVSEPSPERRDRALAAGATSVVGPESLAHPDGLHPVAEPFDVAIECSGNLRAVGQALDQLDCGGTLVLVGTGNPESLRVNHIRVMLLELTITAAFNHDADGFQRALEMMAAGLVPADAVLDPVEVPLAGILDVIERTHHGDVGGKVLVDPWAGRR